MQLIDTHTHIYLPEFNDDVDQTIERAKNARIQAIIFPDIDMKTSKRMHELALQYPAYIYRMSGLHPSSVTKNNQDELMRVEKDLSNDASIVGIGEIGIDLYWDQTFRKEQAEVFTTQLEMAVEKALPVSVHQRNSMKEVMEILQTFNGRVQGVLHCFSGTIEDAKQAIELGFMLGIGGVLTFKNSNLPEIVKYFGASQLVLETDAPYLAPMPYRGKRNEPAYIALICNHLATLLNETKEEIARKTTANAKKIFSKMI